MPAGMPSVAAKSATCNVEMSIVIKPPEVMMRWKVKGLCAGGGRVKRPADLRKVPRMRRVRKSRVGGHLWWPDVETVLRHSNLVTRCAWRRWVPPRASPCCASPM